ncbi:hypothetical protein B566_EDAN009516 [Ephemera danica]|nr:hypothetical protein B566_EDAN009516 [Ephemera danica]
MRLVTTLLMLGVALVFTKCDERPLVHTGLGLLRGTWLTSEQGRSYAAFMTVPFAKPPVGPLRFELPISEQNISLPVIVYLHGGAFMFSGGIFWGSKYMMDRDVVFITTNYRLGPLGFLSLGDSVCPGNNGMRDQVEALRWVRDHISNFGGDPNSVTLLGQSAGGASVHYHYMSPLSRGLYSSLCLFLRGASLSGTALCRWALADKAREKALQLAVSVGCPKEKGSRRLLNCLKSRPADRILMKVEQFQMWQYTPFSPFAPVVEHQQTPPPFLPEAPASALARGAMLRAPWITGIVTAEGLYPAGSFVNVPAELQRLDRDFELLVPHLLDFNWTVVPEQQHEVARRVREEYFGQQAVNEDSVANVVKVTCMVSDRLFVVDAQRAAELQASFSPVYFYKFNFRGGHSLTDIMTDSKKDFGVGHSDDVTYFLNVSFLTSEVIHTGMEKQVEILMLDLWSSFAKNGKTTMKLVTAFLIISMSLRFTKCDERPLVHTGLGLLRGTWLTSEQGRSYAAFMTVPFAKPPVGPLRFEPPVPMEPWDGEWDAGQPAPTCMAYSHMLSPRDKRRIKGQEDCLYLNVYAPRLPSSEPNISLPVIVYLHGGAFMYGGGTFWGAKFMMDRDVLFVTINYRLGPLGLFQRGISLSGTALCRWALADKAREKALQLAVSVGCPTNEGSRRLLNCLKSRPADRILMNVGQFQMWQYTPFSPFAPVVEHQQTPPPFLPEAPASALARGAMLRAPWITGIVTEEGLYPTAEFINKPVELQRLDRDFELVPEASNAPTWSPVTPGGELEYLYIPSVPPVMAQEADLGNAAFWESLPILESEQSLVFHNNSL